MSEDGETAEPEVYLSAADIAGHFKVSANTFHSWQTRYGPDRTPAEIAKAPTCPQPDVYLGVKKPQAGYRRGRLAEFAAWRASLPGKGAGGGRPKSA